MKIDSEDLPFLAWLGVVGIALMMVSIGMLAEGCSKTARYRHCLEKGHGPAECRK